ncbi:probable DNA-directed RNA polymerase subunit delta, partial [Stegodyphus dumicola]|uniref:probable DNA-directed RNA polymerase subunit delta n=1 Tax=Stegodyphus dumicola TaxID=202533 RepID=UPI0015B2F949
MKKFEVAPLSSGDEDDGESAVLSLDSSFLVTSDSEDSLVLRDFGRDMITDLQETPLPKELELRAGSQPLEYALWTKVELSRGKRFGPIPAQLKDSQPPSSDVWRVVDENGTVKAWVDTLVVREGQWTTFLRKSDNAQARNVSPIFFGGQRCVNQRYDNLDLDDYDDKNDADTNHGAHDDDVDEDGDDADDDMDQDHDIDYDDNHNANVADDDDDDVAVVDGDHVNEDYVDDNEDDDVTHEDNDDDDVDNDLNVQNNEETAKNKLNQFEQACADPANEKTPAKSAETPKEQNAW